MATITKRGPYQWRVQVRRHGYPPQFKTFDTKADAEAWAADIESRMARRVWVSTAEAERTTLTEALERYEREITRHKRGGTVEAYHLASVRRDASGLLPRSLAAIRSADIADLRDSWLRAGLAPATVVRRLTILGHVFSVARREWRMESLQNPVTGIRKPSMVNARTRRITTDSSRGDEIERVIAASHSTVLPTVIRLAAETAMRRGEILALRWEHIDLERRTAHLPKTKNGEVRNVPLSTAAVDALRGLNPGAKSTGRVFSIADPHSITHAFERAVGRARAQHEQECAEAGIQPDQTYLRDLRFHDLRHEATSRLADKFAVHELAKITGHRDPRMLMRYYHPRAEDLAKKLG